MDMREPLSSQIFDEVSWKKFGAMVSCLPSG